MQEKKKKLPMTILGDNNVFEEQLLFDRQESKSLFYYLLENNYIDDVCYMLEARLARIEGSEQKYYYITTGNMVLNVETIELIKKHLKKDSIILEFGSGYGTNFLSKHFKMISIEESKLWTDIFDSEYLHAPIKDDWYDTDKVNNFIKDKSYDAILIDGPANGDRKKMIELLETGKLKLNLDVSIFIDDIEREDSYFVSERLADISGRKLNIETIGYIRSGCAPNKFGYIKQKEIEND